MRKLAIVSQILVIAFALTPAQADHVVVVPVAEDGDHPFCSAGQKLPTADGCTQPEAEYAQGRWARRHTHAGIPWAQETPPVHGWGVPPSVIEVIVPEEVDGEPVQRATLSVTVAFGWDQSVPGGAANDVHLHLWNDENRTSLVATSVDSLANIPFVSPHRLVVALDPGTYYMQEDVWFGEHTWWMTNGTLTLVT